MTLSPWQIMVVGFLSAIIGWTANGWRLNGEIAQINADAVTATNKHRDEIEKEKALRADKLATADQLAIEAIADEREKTQSLQRCIDSGTGCGLRVKTVIRPGACVSTGETPGLGAGSEQFTELDPSARSNYYALRRQLVATEEALKVCVRATQ